MPDVVDQFDEPAEPGAPQAEAHLADYWVLIVKRRRLIVACIALGLIAGAAITALMRPRFLASTTLDVARQQSNPFGMKAESGGGSTDPDFLPSQTELMRSRGVAALVVKKLNLLADPAFNPKHYQEFRPNKDGVARIPKADEIVDAALSVRDSIEATIVRGTSLVEISCQARSARLAADLANAVADSYIDWNIESRFKLIGQSAQFLGSQIEQAKAELDAKEKELLAYGRQKDIVSIDPQSNAAFQKLDSVNRDYSAAVADRIAKEARYEEIRSARPEAIAETSPGSPVGQLRSELEKLERDYAEKLNVFKPEWPAMVQLKAQIERSRQSLDEVIKATASRAQEAARTDYLTALRREQSLKTLAKSQQSEAFTEGGNATEYKNLRVEVDTKRALLDNLLRQQGETEVISRLRQDQLTNIRVVDRALPPERPFAPSLPRNLGMGFVVGLAAGVGLAFFLSYLDRTIRTPEQVERYLNLPTLGVIPSSDAVVKRAALRRSVRSKADPAALEMTGKIELLPHESPNSPIAEAYRTFRTALLLSRAGGVRTLVVTSTFPQEGKSATAANLAIVLAQLGRRVLIVDADLHKSRIHEVFGVPNRVGLVSILAEGVEPSRAIVKSAIPGVFVVPAGPDAPNPSALLSSGAMLKFLELAGTNFDHVIVDTPPILAVSDALVFSRESDGALLCIHGGVTPRDAVRRARDRIARSGVPILGVLINAIEPESIGYEVPYYGYGYSADGSRYTGSEDAEVAATHSS